MSKLNKKLYKNNAITLVALVVTIVILLILASVSLNLVIGQNGLITKAKEAKQKTEDATKSEESEAEGIQEYIDDITNTLPKTKETKPYMPSAEFSRVKGTNLKNGLVIEDSNGNQYVWVEVPMTDAVYQTAGLNITEFNTDEYTKIENDLHIYTAIYRNNTNYTDTWHEDTSNPDDWYTKEEYSNAKQKMLKSIYQNGGFWIGRYEAGINTNRDVYTEPTEIPQTKENLYPYTRVNVIEAKRLCENIKYENYTCGLMFGVQWDLVLAFFQNNGTEIENLKNDSSKIGNYYNSDFKINRGKYVIKINGKLNTEWKEYYNNTKDYIENNYKKIVDSKSGVLLTTGASEQNCIMNIYDMAGNVWEWTIENSQESNGTMRGGNYISNGAEENIAFRYAYDFKNRGNNVGFRLTIY